MNYDAYDTSKISEFNSAFAFFNRCNIIYYGVLQAKLDNDPHMLFTWLYSLFGELCDDMTVKERDEIAKYEQNIKPMLDKYDKIFQHTKRRVVDWQLRKLLMDFEIFLRTVYNKKGYKTRSTLDPSKALM